jgi:hypothetical protein
VDVFYEDWDGEAYGEGRKWTTGGKRVRDGPAGLKRMFAGKSKGSAYAKNMRDRALTGEGRWCFFVVRGKKAVVRKKRGRSDGRMGVIPEEDYEEGELEHEEEERQGNDEGVPPYMVLAFPSSIITRSTECLHIPPPDCSLSQMPSPTVTSNLSAPAPNHDRKPARLSSMPNLNPAIHRASSMFLPTPLRHQVSGSRATPSHSTIQNTGSAAADSLSTLNDHASAPNAPFATINVTPPSPPAKAAKTAASGPASIAPKAPEPITVKRTLLYFECAGSIPLVEGYKTDVAAWRPFLEAVGQGTGKGVIFSERGGKGVTH